MLKKISSSLPSFKELNFHEGLNVIIAKKETDATDKQTRNRAGKTSIIEIIHFLFGAKVSKESLFRTSTLINESFRIDFNFDGKDGGLSVLSDF